MSSPEHSPPEKTPDQLLDDAEVGFALSYRYVFTDARRIRAGAANAFHEGVTRKLRDALTAQGVPLEFFDDLLSDPTRAREELMRLVPDEVREIAERRDRIIAGDPLALNALLDEVYLVDQEDGHTRND